MRRGYTQNAAQQKGLANLTKVFRQDIERRQSMLKRLMMIQDKRNWIKEDHRVIENANAMIGELNA